jgi:5'-nucleotidase
MSEPPRILLTNDDGIDAVGLTVLHEALAEIADVTVVAPTVDRSGAGRSDSRRFAVTERIQEYAVDGTPVDCVHYARGALDPSFDLVVAGCNNGPNLGAHKLARSGTVGAAVEAAFLGVPGFAVSLYSNPKGRRDFERDDYDNAGSVARRLVERTLRRADVPFDYCNVNVPADPTAPTWRLTEPTVDFDVRIESTDDGDFRTWDHFYDPLAPGEPGTVTDAVGTDRRAVADEEVSVSPLSIAHQVPTFDSLPWLVDSEDG